MLLRIQIQTGIKYVLRNGSFAIIVDYYCYLLLKKTNEWKKLVQEVLLSLLIYIIVKKLGFTELI